MMLYRPETQEVLLARFTDSAMVADNVGKSTSQLEEFWRTKTYVKPTEMLGADYPVFPQPYQVAQARLGGTWNDYNRTFIIQIAGCNLACGYCLCDPELRCGVAVIADKHVGGWFSAKEVVGMWRQSGSGVLRVSGGEPTLASQFLFDLYRALPAEPQAFMWVDTNLSTGDRLFDAYNSVENAEIVETMGWAQNIALCGCFKGFTAEDAVWATRTGHLEDSTLLDDQFTMAQRIVEDTDLDVYFYIPDAVGPATTTDHIRDFFIRMRDQVDDIAPLRTYVLQLKNYAPVVSSWWAQHTGMVRDLTEQATTEFVRPITAWARLCYEFYGPELTWLPSHQLRFLKRGG